MQGTKMKDFNFIIIQIGLYQNAFKLLTLKISKIKAKKVIILLHDLTLFKYAIN